MWGPQAALQAVGAWRYGFRPTHVMFIVDGMVPNIYLSDYANDIVVATNYVSGTPLEIVNQTTDIYNWRFLDWTGIHYTDILFYVQ